MQDEVIPVRHEPEKKRRGIFGWGKREEPRVEPAPRVQPTAQHSMRPSAPQPRALAQAEPLRPVPQPAAPQGSDLFADQKSGDQFEIPAFLRKQTN
jgi:cell division protein FtsZ